MYEDATFASNLRESLRTPGASYHASLISTVKSTKGEGLVSQRNIHAASRYSFAGVAYWLANEIQVRLNKLPHLLPAGRDFVQRLRDFSFPPDQVLTMIELT